MVVLSILDEFDASETLCGLLVMLVVVTSTLTSSHILSGEAVTVLLFSLH